MIKIIRTLSLLTMTALFGAAGAQTPPAKPAKPAMHEITGFRSARFGMTGEEVRQAIVRDFNPAADLVKEFDNPVEKTHVIVLPLETLEPGTVPASVTYILGATTRRLMQVNVQWSSGDTPTDADRAQISATALQLAAYFRGLAWRPDASTTGLPSGPNGIVLFAGIDPKLAAVEVRLSGVTVGNGPAPTGPARVRVAYAAKVGQPDVAAPVKPGTF